MWVLCAVPEHDSQIIKFTQKKRMIIKFQRWRNNGLGKAIIMIMMIVGTGIMIMNVIQIFSNRRLLEAT
jgi:predicted anti-sigma-YlaC factor YlaD